ncbi:MAG: glutamate synthase large subunit [Verrucomicrobiales bacterium]
MNQYYAPHLNNEGTLHRADFEHDACGVGFVANIHGTRSNRVLRYGLTSCCNVVHRGAIDADQKTGDGAGVLTNLPYKILVPAVRSLGGSLEKDSDLGVGVFFLPNNNEGDALKAKILAEGVVRNRGGKVFGWREVPVNKNELGKKAQEACPQILHLLVGRPEGIGDDAFERTLFLTRREIERRLKAEGVTGAYIPSFSHRVISYKALLVATALQKFFLDLQDPRFETAICIYHQRFSTNTFPTWPLAQPFRMLAHNGEINTVRGNRNWMRTREAQFQSEIWGDDIEQLRDLIDPSGSDSCSLDNALELLVLSGRSLEHAMTMLITPAWRIDPFTTKEEEDFYQYHRCFSEPWDGPAALSFTDGIKIAGCLDRNGLRPSRFKLTEDGIFTLGSEVGVVEIDDATVVRKGRLAPGEMILVDTSKGEVLFNKEIKHRLAAQNPYGEWLKANRIEFSDHCDDVPQEPEGDLDILGLSQRQVAFGFNQEEADMVLEPMIKNAMEATYSMGDDTPLSVLSKKPRLLFTYFKQLFAQVTNPPIDPIREELVMSLSADIGPERNILGETPEHARVIHLEHPFLLPHQIDKLLDFSGEYPAKKFDITWPAAEGADAMEAAVDALCREAEAAADAGTRILVLSDRAVSESRASIPSLIAIGAVHHYLTHKGKRMNVSLLIETGEARDVHQMACLIGFGATAICPYLAYENIRELLENDRKGKFEGLTYTKAAENYRKALRKGLMKIMSKMGISVLNSYQGAQIFEAIGLGKKLMDKCFAGTPSQLEGVGFSHIAAQTLVRHRAAYAEAVPDEGPLKLDDPGYNRYRRDGETHSIGGADVLKPFHAFVKSAEPSEYEQYVEGVLKSHPVALHDMFEFVPSAGGPISIDEVEPIEDIRVRFTTAAMSLGALSPEAHETLAIAMNRIGGKSNSGEGGEDKKRFHREENGDWKISKIKQVASGRFGVSAEYLSYAQELEIKMAQGAKPGEGGQLPAHKVSGLIARLRHTQPGVQLISPPPHHDIYSIEDLAQLIHDLKQVNPRARVCVKLVAETGVGTIAAGVAKANADIILISGHEGGTGASPLSSIKHAGLPWEIGLAETQQVLMLNGLRDRVTLRTDGGLRTGRDIVSAALLGAEEFNFGTIAMIAMGCVYVRKCHLNNCPVGVATTDPKYRAKFKGSPDNVVNFFNAVAEDVRKIMASLGVAKLDDLIGHPEFLRQREVPDHPKANTLNFSRILRNVAKENGADLTRICRRKRNDGLHEAPLDDRIILDAHDAVTEKKPVVLDYKVRNTNRNVGTKLSGAIAYEHGNHGLPDGTITINLRGSAGQSFGTFLCGGIRLSLTGEANDYVGKGMCGGEIIIRPSAEAKFEWAENALLGNTVMYGSTGGKLFASAPQGERFCVRNSGGTAVVEGVGDHGCEYMTNGTVVILGRTGKNFGAGMSGGLAFVYDIEGNFEKLINPEMIEVEPLADTNDITLVRELIAKHLDVTGSPRAQEILDNWETHAAKFKKVRPTSEPVEVALEDPSDAPTTADPVPA